MRTILILALFSLLTACGNKVETQVPENIKVDVAPVSGELIVKHVFQIELPTVLSDDCKRKFPNDEAAYTACVAEYIKYLTNIINTVPPVPTIP